MPNYDIQLDAIGLSCPMPVMKCAKELRKMKPGQVLYLKASDPGSKDDVRTMLQGSADMLLESSESSGIFHFYIKKA